MKPKPFEPHLQNLIPQSITERGNELAELFARGYQLGSSLDLATVTTIPEPMDFGDTNEVDLTLDYESFIIKVRSTVFNLGQEAGIMHKKCGMAKFANPIVEEVDPNIFTLTVGRIKLYFSVRDRLAKLLTIRWHMTLLPAVLPDRGEVAIIDRFRKLQTDHPNQHVALLVGFYRMVTGALMEVERQGGTINMQRELIEKLEEQAKVKVADELV